MPALAFGRRGAQAASGAFLDWRRPRVAEPFQQFRTRGRDAIERRRVEWPTRPAHTGNGLVAIEEAVALYRRLAEDSPAVYETKLANALLVRSNTLSEGDNC